MKERGRGEGGREGGRENSIRGQQHEGIHHRRMILAMRIWHTREAEREAERESEGGRQSGKARVREREREREEGEGEGESIPLDDNSKRVSIIGI